MAARVKSDIMAIALALDEYAINNSGKYPDSLEVLITPDMNGNAYIRSKVLPVDPWKRAYLYEEPKTGNGMRPRIYTLGADGKIGGTGLDADIDNLMFEHAPR
jgi:general secretion pathway protein G